MGVRVEDLLALSIHLSSPVVIPARKAHLPQLEVDGVRLVTTGCLAVREKEVRQSTSWQRDSAACFGWIRLRCVRWWLWLRRKQLWLGFVWLCLLLMHCCCWDSSFAWHSCCYSEWCFRLGPLHPLLYLLLLYAVLLLLVLLVQHSVSLLHWLLHSGFRHSKRNRWIQCRI